MYTLKLNIGSWTTPIIGGGYILSDADNSGVKLVKEVDDDNYSIARIKVAGDFRFYADEFEALKTIKEGQGDFIDAKIYYDGLERVDGIINLSTGSWDENTRVQYLSFQVRDTFTDVFKNKDYKYNICSANSITAWLRFTSVLYTGVEYCYPGNPADFQNNVNPDGTANPSGIVSSEWNYFTIISADVCPEGGRTYVFVTTYTTFEAPGYEESEFFPGWFLKKETSPMAVNIEIPNRWVKLYYVIERMLSQIDSSINISESTYCTYFTVDKPYFNYLMLADKSDVKRRSANKAFYEYIRFSDLMTYLKDMFNLDWTIENGYFKLKRSEASSTPDFNTYPKHDFTTINNGISICDNQQRYQYTQDNKVYRETWEFELSDDERYYKSQIDYASLNDDPLEHSILSMNNDVSYLISDPVDANDSGFVMIATEEISGSSDRDIINLTIDGAEEVNYYMSALKLVQENQLTERPYSSGVIDGVATELGIKPDRENVYKNVPISDIDDLNFSYLVKCELGDVKCMALEIEMSLSNFATFKGRL